MDRSLLFRSKISLKTSYPENHPLKIKITKMIDLCILNKVVFIYQY